MVVLEQILPLEQRTEPVTPPVDRASAYLEGIPLELAASVRDVLNLGDTVLVACRPPTNPHSNPLNALTENEYRFLVYAAHSQSNAEIGYGLGRAGATARHHLHEANKKLGVHTRAHAAAYIPIDEKELRTFCLFRIKSAIDDGGGNKTAETIIIPKLSAIQAQVYEALVDGASPKQIARELKLSGSTIRTHISDITADLGLKDRVELIRLGGAARNIANYSLEIQGIANFLLPAIQQAIKAVNAVRSTDKQQLASEYYLTRKVTATLRQTASTSLLICGHRTKHIAKAMIVGEVQAHRSSHGSTSI